MGWLPGPVGGSAGRAYPSFTGPTPGPTSTELDSESGADEIMAEVQLTDDFLRYVVAAAKQHVAAWAAGDEDLGHQ